jgi:hypothetical protein
VTGGGGKFWWRWLAVTLIVFGLAWALLASLDTGPRPIQLLLLVLLGMAVLALANLSVVSDGPDWSVDSVSPVSPPGQDTRLGMYTRVISGHLDSRDPDPGLRDRFADLADRRLHQRRGFGLRDPRATDVLGPATLELLTGPPRRLSRTQIRTCVEKIEEI